MRGRRSAGQSDGSSLMAGFSSGATIPHLLPRRRELSYCSRKSIGLPVFCGGWAAWTEAAICALIRPLSGTQKNHISQNPIPAPDRRWKGVHFV